MIAISIRPLEPALPVDIMAHVVTDKCRGCKFTDCAEVCPVACFYELDNQLVIHPEDCIDCTACVAECPVEAIYDETQLPDDKKGWIAINAERGQALPVVNEQGSPLPGAEERKEKLGF